VTQYVEPYDGGPWGWVFGVLLVLVVLLVGWVLSRLAEHGEYEREEAEDIIENADMIDAIQRMFRAHLVEGLVHHGRRQQAQQERMTHLKRLRQRHSLRKSLEKCMPAEQALATLRTLGALRATGIPEQSSCLLQSRGHFSFIDPAMKGGER
jgi:hypothetical protein